MVMIIIIIDGEDNNSNITGKLCSGKDTNSNCSFVVLVVLHNFPPQYMMSEKAFPCKFHPAELLISQLVLWGVKQPNKAGFSPDGHFSDSGLKQNPPLSSRTDSHHTFKSKKIRACSPFQLLVYIELQ